MDIDFFDDVFKDYEWEDELVQDDRLDKKYNDMGVIAFQKMNDKQKIEYLYNKISYLYSHLFSKKDVD